MIKTLTKNCLYCNAEFVITVTSTSRGSSNVLRKKYCTILCKKKMSINNSVIAYDVFCLNCNKQFKTYPSVKSTYCSVICRQQQHSQKLKKIKAIEISCLFCFSKFETFNYQKKYCNDICKKNFRIKKFYKECCCTLCNKIFLRKKQQLKVKMFIVQENVNFLVNRMV